MLLDIDAMRCERLNGREKSDTKMTKKKRVNRGEQ
jgi:hypothetical protein